MGTAIVGTVGFSASGLVVSVVFIVSSRICPSRSVVKVLLFSRIGEPFAKVFICLLLRLVNFARTGLRFSNGGVGGRVSVPYFGVGGA